MQNPLTAPRAKARARQRGPAVPAACVALAPPDAPLELALEVDVELAEAPFAPPPLDDIFGVGECGDDELPPSFDDEAPFDPPELDDEPVFTAPAPAVTETAPPLPLPRAHTKPAHATPRERAMPAIAIYAGWDRPESEALMRELAADPRLARAEFEIARGGLDGALAYCAAHEPPDLIILDTTLQGRPMLAGLDHLRDVAPRAVVVVLGNVNDITLLRELAARGVADYIVPPVAATDLAASLCRMFTSAEPARVIAVIGARGGVGASTIAHNLAFSISERQRSKTTLVDFDVSSGSAALRFGHTAQASVSSVLDAREDAEVALSCALAPLTPHLQLVCAPDQVTFADIEPEVFDRALSEMRRTAAHVILDLPHHWAPWVRRALRHADEVVIVAGPDLASLRNTDNMLKLLRSERDKPSPAHVVLSMVGIPKRPEIPTRDFADAICVEPATSFAFEPELFGHAATQNQMIYEAVPDAKAALQIDSLASLLTGRAAVAEPRRRVGAQAPDTKPQVPPPPLEAAPPLELTIVARGAEGRPKRRAARTGFVSLQAPRRRSTGLLRAAVALIALTSGGAWFAHEQTRASEAAQIATDAFRA